MAVPIYFFTGFLESGKTTLIRETIQSPDFQTPGKTLLLVCEEGEEEYEEDFLEKYRIVKLDIQKPEQLSDSFWKNVDRMYEPDQVFLEYNGTWSLEPMLTSELGGIYEIAGIYSTVDGVTAEAYFTNMRNLIMEQIGQSNLIIVNRCTEQTPLGVIRRSVKIINPEADLVYEDPDGNEVEFSAEALPFDMDADVIEIDDVDFGLWYLDTMDNGERYDGKTVRFLAMLYIDPKMKRHTMAAGRHVMTCCEADITFCSCLCKCKTDYPEFKKGDWAWVTAEYHYEFAKEYRGKGPVLYIKELEAGLKPENPVVRFS